MSSTAWGPGERLGALSPDATHMWGSAGSWDPLWLRPTQVRSAVARLFGMSVGEPALLAQGLWNQSWQLSSDVGPVVLRVIRPDLALDQVRYEHDVTARLRAAVPEVVVPLSGLDGDTIHSWDGALVVLYPFVHGVTAAELPADVGEPLAARMLARLHTAGMALALPQRSGELRVDEQPTIWSTVGPALWQELPHSRESLAFLRDLDTEAASLEAWMHEVTAQGRLHTFGLVHGDFNPRNLVVDGGAIVAVLDWETVQVDALAAELSGAIFAARRPTAYRCHYRDAGGPVDDAEMALLPGLARRHALLELQFAVDQAGHAKPNALRKLREVHADLARLPAVTRG